MWILSKLISSFEYHFHQLDCSPACKPDQPDQSYLEAAMSTTALPNFIIIINYNHRHSINCQLEIAIYLQALVGSSQTFKLKLLWPNQTLHMIQMKTTSTGRQPQILKLKYLCNHWLDLPQILNLSLYDQTRLYIWIKSRRSQMKDDLQWKTTTNIKSEISLQPVVGSSPNFKLKLIWPNQTLHMIQTKTDSNGTQTQTLKVKYLCNHWSALPQILNLSIYDQNNFEHDSIEDDL